MSLSRCLVCDGCGKHTPKEWQDFYGVEAVLSDGWYALAASGEHVAHYCSAACLKRAAYAVVP